MKHLIDWLAAKRSRYLVTLLVVTVLFRLPSLAVHVIDADEAMYAIAARGILKGLVMYRDIVDQKPPLIYYLYALIMTAVNDLRFVHFATIFVVWATAVSLGRVLTSIYSREIGIVGAILYVLSMSTIGQPSNTEVFMNLPIVLGIACFIAAPQAQRRHAYILAAGLFVGVASLIKPQGGLVIVPLGIVLLMQKIGAQKRPLFLAASALVIGALLPYLPVVAYFGWHGALHDMLHWAYLNNLNYPAPSDGSRWILAKAFLVPVLSANLILWYFALKRFLEPRYRDALSGNEDTLILGILWLAISCYAVSMGQRWYTHYFIQLAPPLVFLAAPPIARHLMNPRAMAGVRRIVFLVLVFAPALGYTACFCVKIARGGYDCQKPAVVEASRFIREHSAPDDRVFTWGSSVITYMSNRLNASRFVHCAFAFENRDPCHIPEHADMSRFSQTAEFGMMMSDLETHQPAMIVDTSRSNIHCWGRFPLDRFEQLDDFVREHYAPLQRYDGLDIYGYQR